MSVFSYTISPKSSTFAPDLKMCYYETEFSYCILSIFLQHHYNR